LEVDSLAAIDYTKARNIPILLTNTRELPSDTLETIKKLGAKNIIIAGE
jgi:putative cell wall-binding protein